MSILKDVLIEERERGKRIMAAYLKEYNALPKGYIVFKSIGKKKYPYFQQREGEKIICKYVKPDELENLLKIQARRRELRVSIRNIAQENLKIERVLKHD